ARRRLRSRRGRRRGCPGRSWWTRPGRNRGSSRLHHERSAPVPKAQTDKVLVTNQETLKRKYGPAFNAAIKPAITALIAADKARGVNTLLVALDSAATMAKYKGKAVSKATDPKQNKAAIDAVWKALTPAYLCILGAVDVVPHQDLVNPISSDG